MQQHHKRRLIGSSPLSCGGRRHAKATVRSSAAREGGSSKTAKVRHGEPGTLPLGTAAHRARSMRKPRT